jgi:hypothetical protein
MTYIILTRDIVEFNEYLDKIQKMIDNGKDVDNIKLANEVDSIKKLLVEITTDFVIEKKGKKRK